MKGMMEKGIIEVSADGNTWRKIEDFRFGNLINDPTARSVYFETGNSKVRSHSVNRYRRQRR
jgi:hypothetical protein